MERVKAFFREVSVLVLGSWICLVLLGVLAAFEAITVVLAIFLGTAAITLMIMSLRE